MKVFANFQMYRIPQRSYRPQSLEKWFERLGTDWESRFTEAELNWGRRFYREADVRSTELLDDSAIVHFKRGREPLYVIIDAEEQQLNFRESHPGFAPGRALAVAGLYEVEEFIADEIPAIAPEFAKEAEEYTVESSPEPVIKRKKEGRRLVARVMATEDGLQLETGWQAADQITWGQFARRELTSWEREQLIGHTARVLHSGFRPYQREGLYRLQELTAVEQFLQRSSGVWRKRFGLLLGKDVLAWQRGLVNVQPEVQVVGSGGQARYRIEFNIGGKLLDGDIRERLWRHPGHVQFVPGRGIYRVAPAALETLHEWRTLLPESGEGVLPRYLLFALEQHPEFRTVLNGELESWRSEILAASDAVASLRLPDYLRPYQRSGVGWLKQLLASGCHPLLADEMGLGKTLQILNLLETENVLGKEPVLVVCPASVVPVWQAEVERFFPGTPVRVVSRHQPFEPSVPALWICSYTQLRRNKSALEQVEFSHAILDEAQTIKNPDAKVTHACSAIRSTYRIALTGTPLENHPLDLWTLFRFLMPGLLGSRRAFESICKRESGMGDVIRARIQPFILRRTKKSVAGDLPDKVEIDWICPLMPRQRRAYSALLEGSTQFLGGRYSSIPGRERMHVFTLLTRLRQASCSVSMLPGEGKDWQQSGKIVSLCARLGEALEGGSKVVVFSQFVQFLNEARKAVRESFPDADTFELTGSTTNRERPVKAFREAPAGAILFVSLRAGGTGLNLQVADYVFLLDPWWNPAVEAQAIDRVHRIGQTKQVMVYRMVTKGTIEDRIQALKRQKGDLFDQLLADTDTPTDILEQFASLEDLVRLDPPTD